MKRILIANRGEIASRIIKSAHALEIETVAIYSEADQSLPFVKEATKAFCIGEAPVQKSYLNQSKIIEIALREKVDAIHPGYGLLSENASFCQLVKENNINWIGPRPETIALMGEKIAAREAMKKAGVPVVPGNQGGILDIEEAVSLADQIGYPIMLKASAGGGGVGLVICDDELALRKAFTSTKGRAKAYFQNDDVFIEKYIEKGRHIEVQIFADQHGEIVHLFERDCSIQRRNQKVLEESLAPSISDMTRKKLYQYAIQAAQYVSYVNAGTVEFIVDQDDNIYFLEMNTRLQVEHPVTEMITGIDLVEWQLKVAAGEKLPLSQADIAQNGHAIELRIYAENPDTLFPSPGTISTLQWGSLDNARLDAGYEEGSNVTPFYDAMIAKYIVKGETREDCLNEARKFLKTTHIDGIQTNIPLLSRILEQPWIIEGNYHTQSSHQLIFKKE